MFTSAMLRDERFNGKVKRPELSINSVLTVLKGHISNAATNLAGGGGSDSALSVIIAVDVCRRVGVGKEVKV